MQMNRRRRIGQKNAGSSGSSEESSSPLIGCRRAVGVGRPSSPSLSQSRPSCPRAGEGMGAEAMGRRSDGAPRPAVATCRGLSHSPRASPPPAGTPWPPRAPSAALLGGPAQRPCSASCPWREGPRGGDVQVRSGADGRTGRAGARRGAGFLPALTGDGPLVRWSSGRRSRSASRFIRNQAPISSTPPTPIVNSPRDR